MGRRVGWNDWEEIDVVNTNGVVVENFGWPCYEGIGGRAGYDGANLSICETLYAGPAADTKPYFAYHHSERVVPNETCPTGKLVDRRLGVRVAPRGAVPGRIPRRAVLRRLLAKLHLGHAKGGNGNPAPGSIRTFVAGASNPVNLEFGPNGDLFYVDFDGGTIRRITYASANQHPVAVANATPTTGPAPLTVRFDGTGSSDPDGETRSVMRGIWTTTGVYDDSTAARPTYTYTTEGIFHGQSPCDRQRGRFGDADSVTITVGNKPHQLQ